MKQKSITKGKTKQKSKLRQGETLIKPEKFTVVDGRKTLYV